MESVSLYVKARLVNTGPILMVVVQSTPPPRRGIGTAGGLLPRIAKQYTPCLRIPLILHARGRRITASGQLDEVQDRVRHASEKAGRHKPFIWTPDALSLDVHKPRLGPVVGLFRFQARSRNVSIPLQVTHRSPRIGYRFFPLGVR